MIQRLSPPRAREVSIYLCERVCMKMDRLIRTKPGTPLMPTAMITVANPGPRPATRIIARSKPGIESKALENHMMRRSTQCGEEADITPIKPPVVIESRADEIAALKLNLAP